MDIKRLKERKKELRYTNKDIAELSGVPLGTVQKVFGNTTKEPRRDTFMALASVLEPEWVCGHSQYVNSVREEALVYEAVIKKKKQGEYTLDDYYALPDDQRVELIDGFFYELSSPSTAHQRISGRLFSAFYNYIREEGGRCEVFAAPFDVQLDSDERTMVQPDLVVICDPDRIEEWGLFGAPDLIVEILSPATMRKDRTLKVTQYGDAGVREYWIVDPVETIVLIHTLEDGQYSSPNAYGASSTAPVGITEDCTVDLSLVFSGG